MNSSHIHVEMILFILSLSFDDFVFGFFSQKDFILIERYSYLYTHESSYS